MDKRKKVKYIGYYDILHNGKKTRNYSLAAAKKMDYICSVLTSIGFDTEIISAAYSIRSGTGYISSCKQRISEGVELITPPSLKANNKLMRIARVIIAQIWLFFYLIKTCKKDEKVIVYHNYNLAIPVLLAKKLRGFRIILEIEEKYAMVWELMPYQKWRENLLLKQADKNSLVVSDVLKELLHIDDGIVSYGSYSIYKGLRPKKKAGNKIRLVFTGSIDKARGGGFISVNAMRYLPPKYELIISGIIAKEDESDFLNEITNVNKAIGREGCKYVGILSDTEYTDLLLNADIALNPQKEGDFGSFVFPSKILTYMSHGLPVVSTKGESIVKSQLADLITFADGYEPEIVAKAIQNVEAREINEYTDRLEKLSQEFVDRLKALLE